MAEPPPDVHQASGAITDNLHWLSHGTRKCIVDIQGSVQELKDEYTDCLIPIDDDNQKLHRFFQKVEYLLQCEQKDKFSLLGNRKDYWDYFVKCLTSARNVHDGVKFVKSVTEFKTSLGRGRAFLRFCLIHRCLADTLQQCFQNERVTSDFYRDVSPLMSHDCTSRLIAAFYELSEVNFDLCPHGYDLDVAWPTFAKRSFVAQQPWYPLWRAPSRTVSMSSLVSTSQLQQSREVWQNSFTSRGENEGEDRENSRQSVEEASFSQGNELLTEKLSLQGDIELRARLAELEATTADYAQKLEKASVEQRKQEELQETSRRATERAELELKERTASCHALEERLETKQLTEDALNDQLTAARFEKQSVSEQLDKWKQLVSGYVERLAVKDRLNEHLERQVSALREATDALREMMHLRTSECTALRNLVQELKAVHQSRVERNDDGSNGRVQLETEREAWTAEVNKLRDRICELESEKSASEHEDCDRPVVPNENANAVDLLKSQVDDLNRELESLKAKNGELEYRLEVLRGWMLRVENAETELDELTNGSCTREKIECCGGGEERSDPEGMGEDCDMEAQSSARPVFEEDLSLITAVRRTLNRLHCLIADRREGSTSGSGSATSETTDRNLVSRVKEQEAKLSCVTMELGEARALVDQLREAFTRLQTSEAVLRYELGEKRNVVDRLRRQLESSRSQWSLIRQKNSESEQDFLSLRAEFASRLVPALTSQGSEESGCEELVADAASSTGGDDLVCRSLASPSPDVDKSVDDAERRGCATAALDCEEVMTPVSESPSTSSNYDVSDTTRKSRLRLMEEQCRLLYAQLVQSRKKSELLEWKLAHLHIKHGGASSSEATNESDELLVEESIENPDNLDTETERNLELEEEEVPSYVDDVSEPPAATLGDDDLTTTNDDAIAEASVLVSKPGTLELAQALPRRIVKLKREKDNLARDVSRLRLAQQQFEEDAACRVDAEKDGLRSDLERARATLVEFKRRVELVMRKEREEKEARYKLAMEAKRELQLKVERLEGEVRDRENKLERLEGQIRRSTEESAACRLGLEQEVHSLRFRLGTETLAKEQAAKHHARHESDVALLTDKLAEHEQLVAALEEELASIRTKRHAEIERQNAQLVDLQLCLSTREDECTVLNNELKETTRCLDEERRERACLRTAAEESLAECTHLRCRLDEALTDSHELQKKIIKLIREKDRLWQRSEHLSFQQKIQATDRWLKDEETTHCLACRAEFTLVLRKHHCRLCGRIFCFNCCNHWAMTASSSRRVRVCNECIIRHSQIDNITASLENEESEDDDVGATASTAGVSYITSQSPCDDSAISGSPSSTSNETTMQEAGNDVNMLVGSIAEEAREESAVIPSKVEPGKPSSVAVTAAASSPSRSTSTDGKQNHHGEHSVGGGHSVLGRLFSSWSSSSASSKSVRCVPDDEEFCVIGDDEIMKSLSGSSPYWPLAAENSDPTVHFFPIRTIDEIVAEFERGLPREVWVDAGKTCAVPILIEARSTLTWAFTTEPKSIVFTLVFHSETKPETEVQVGDKEGSGSGHAQTTLISSDSERRSPLCASHVLVPRTHCDSHLHPVHGKLVAKRPGVYTLYFDNAFSRFTAKKVKFILRSINKDERLADVGRASSSETAENGHDDDEDEK